MDNKPCAHRTPALRKSAGSSYFRNQLALADGKTLESGRDTKLARVGLLQSEGVSLANIEAGLLARRLAWLFLSERPRKSRQGQAASALEPPRPRLRLVPRPRLAARLDRLQIRGRVVDIVLRASLREQLGIQGRAVAHGNARNVLLRRYGASEGRMICPVNRHVWQRRVLGCEV